MKQKAPIPNENDNGGSGVIFTYEQLKAKSGFSIEIMPKPAIASGKILLENGYTPGKGLGLHGQGLRQPIDARKSAMRRHLGIMETKEVEKPKQAAEGEEEDFKV